MLNVSEFEREGKVLDYQIRIALTVIVVGILLLLLIRELVCWYWKINALQQKVQAIEQTITEQLRILEKISLSLQDMTISGRIR